jgi:hypothetical protein
VKRQILSLVRLPITPLPHLGFFHQNIKLFRTAKIEFVSVKANAFLKFITLKFKVHYPFKF